MEALVTEIGGSMRIQYDTNVGLVIIAQPDDIPAMIRVVEALIKEFGGDSNVSFLRWTRSQIDVDYLHTVH